MQQLSPLLSISLVYDGDGSLLPPFKRSVKIGDTDTEREKYNCHYSSSLLQLFFNKFTSSVRRRRVVVEKELFVVLILHHCVLTLK